jgi:hypothetical protein
MPNLHGTSAARLSILGLSAWIAGLVALPSGPAQTDLRTLLRRAGEYVVGYHDSLTALVVEETYRQRLTSTRDGSKEERTLRSEFAIVRGKDEDGWFAVRDVLDVDGQPVEERSRIEALLRAPRARLRSAAFAMAAEQAKYNLGHVYRTINVPTLPLLFLLPDRQSRFRFKALPTPNVAVDGAVAVSYEERDRPTIIRTPNGRNVVSRGMIWMDPAGRVVKTVLTPAEPHGLRVEITVTYDEDPRLKLMVPVSMQELYVTPDAEIVATATYSNFRRFETESRMIR